MRSYEQFRHEFPEFYLGGSGMIFWASLPNAVGGSRLRFLHRDGVVRAGGEPEFSPNQCYFHSREELAEAAAVYRSTLLPPEDW